MPACFNMLSQAIHIHFISLHNYLWWYIVPPPVEGNNSLEKNAIYRGSIHITHLPINWDAVWPKTLKNVKFNVFYLCGTLYILVTYSIWLESIANNFNDLSSPDHGRDNSASVCLITNLLAMNKLITLFIASAPHPQSENFYCEVNDR